MNKYLNTSPTPPFNSGSAHLEARPPKANIQMKKTRKEIYVNAKTIIKPRDSFLRSFCIIKFSYLLKYITRAQTFATKNAKNLQNKRFLNEKS